MQEPGLTPSPLSLGRLRALPPSSRERTGPPLPGQAPDPSLPQDGFAASPRPPQGAAPVLLGSDLPRDPAPPPQAPPPSALTQGDPPPRSAPPPPRVLLDTPPTPAEGAPIPSPPGPPPRPGAGFRAEPRDRRSFAVWLHDVLADRAPRLYERIALDVVGSVSKSLEEGLGLNLKSLLEAEQTLYTALAPSQSGPNRSAPIFEALANGQAAYVNLGPDGQEKATHLMRLFASLPLEELEKLQPSDPEVRDALRGLLDRARSGRFPAFIDTDGDTSTVTPTESISRESISSIARRENRYGNDFIDPRKYYRWLVTRMDSHVQRTAPWLFATSPRIHREVEKIRAQVTPPWGQGRLENVFGFRTDPAPIGEAYESLMKLAGGGSPPSMDQLVDVADAVIGLDRDLLSGTQTHWIHLLAELPPNQRMSLLAPVARAWAVLNLVPPDHPEFTKVSPPTAPYIELFDQRPDQVVLERYDRAMALSEAVDHALDGLGIEDRKQFMNLLMAEFKERQDALVAREDRLRARLGGRYQGIDIPRLLDDPLAIDNPAVVESLGQLRAAMEPQRVYRPMTEEYADLIRHRDSVKWIADRNRRYGDVRFNPLWRHPSIRQDPLMVGEFYQPRADSGSVSTLPPGPSRQLLLGIPTHPDEEPVRMSLVLEGGGGKGFAYVEALEQLRGAFSQTRGTLAVDEFVGTSAGAITASMLAAGYSIPELPEVISRLDFKRFYADYLWLQGGVDPKVRGLDRTGLFSAQTMYLTLDQLLRQKTGVEGRPVLFRDLPFKLKVVATVLNTDLPEDLKRELGIGPDGQIVLSSENTPNMDVAAAVISSAAVPGFFNAPQVQVCRQIPDATDGHPHAEVYRLQLVDGGVVNNFPVAHAREPGSMLIAAPTYTEAPPKEPGGRRARLTTLDFDPVDLPRIAEYNRERYGQFAPQMAELVQQARTEGVGRVVLALNLTTPEGQAAPGVQGETAQASARLARLAERVGMPHLSPPETRQLVQGNLKATGGDGPLQRAAVELLLDRDNTFDLSWFRDPTFRPQAGEARGIPDLLLGVAAATVASDSRREQKLFERG